MGRLPWIIWRDPMKSQGSLWEGKRRVSVCNGMWSQNFSALSSALLALKTEEGATNQGVQAASSSRKRQESRFSPGAPRGRCPWGHLSVSQVKPISDLRSRELRGNPRVLFWGTKFVAIYYSSNRKWIQWYEKVKVLVAQLCPTVCDSMDFSPPGSSVHGILQAKILEWVAIPFSRGSSQTRDQTRVSHIASGLLTIWATREAQWYTAV